MKIIDLTGQRFERLVVTGRAPNKSEKDTNARWHCKCDCGRMCIAYGQDLRREKFKSCGCLNAERIYKHGQSRTKAYRTWITLRQRCENQKNVSYPKYGGDGVVVCERWKVYENFYSDMGDAPSIKHTIDRIDGTKGYEPSNCRWATYGEQNRNISRNVWVEIDGVNKVLHDWCKELGINHKTVTSRIRNGWSAESALTTPLNPVGVNFNHR